MTETFAASTKYKLTSLHHTYIKGEPEFLRFGRTIFESEDLLGKLYDIYASLNVQGWVNHTTQPSSSRDIFQAYVDGFYLPCTERVVLSGQVDLKNDRLPEYAGLILFEGLQDEGSITFVNTQKLDATRNGVAFMPQATPLASTVMWREGDAITRADAKALGSGDLLQFHTAYISLMPDGRLLPAREMGVPKTMRRHTGSDAMFCQVTAATINAWEDRRYVWLVNTDEHVIGRSDRRTPLQLGVDEGHVKSLFYARSLPVTDTGRKRPILHWVRAHQRRMKAGVDIDVRKHLRGNERFEMGGFNFAITQPRKEAKRD